jgi:hypothetical protein
MIEMLDINILSKTDTQAKEVAVLKFNGIPTDNSSISTDLKELNCDERMSDDFLLEKMGIYLIKMSVHDLDLASYKPSLLAVGSIYVALKICEQLKNKSIINASIVHRIMQVS